MSWFDFLKLGKRWGQSPLPPIRTVRQPGTARREREELADAEAAATSRVDPSQDFLDTGSLEIARESTDGDNPYDTQTWATTPGGLLHRVDDLSAVNKKRKSGSKENPYDTKVKRKGW
ncbi:MAG: hypothetical protein E2O52_10150 [Gammaproteobacteria bacterium]|nr:MAG: hypothetical protein E2O52_10150 [Gammaproteobacteria bacterium]